MSFTHHYRIDFQELEPAGSQCTVLVCKGKRNNPRHGFLIAVAGDASSETRLPALLGLCNSSEAAAIERPTSAAVIVCTRVESGHRRQRERHTQRQTYIHNV